MMKVLDQVSAILKEKGGQIWFVNPSATVYEALEIMADKRIGALLVMERGRLQGVISERDYARKIILNGRSSRATQVSEIMTPQVVTVTADQSVDEAMRRMTDHRIRHLPVVDGDGTVLGVISIGDLVKWIISSHEKTIEQLESYIGGQVTA